ncbi:hypothetical protein [Flocculibacter collagenilyticus]|uniref:hypothetical protein n=1 Tax=Flocculibacter collagenilyticus TaxID=2744479 RepID=UPI0018F59DFE|nr:hypothetical protein [Flocculibacter collagenilyticus]
MSKLTKVLTASVMAMSLGLSASVSAKTGSLEEYLSAVISQQVSVVSQSVTSDIFRNIEEDLQKLKAEFQPMEYMVITAQAPSQDTSTEAKAE